MEAIAKLGTLLGLSFVSGVNLYATVAVVGLCLKYGLVHGLPPELQVLANDAVILVALFLYLIEFVIDKVPGLDTLWDTLHTVIRPLGGALLAVMQVGEGSPALEVIVFLLGASLAAAAHATKAGTRLLVQASPEPFSNMALSVGEDVFVVGYAYLSLSHPYWTLAGTLALLVGCFLLFPLLMRSFLAVVRLLFRRFQRLKPARSGDPSSLPELPDVVDERYMETASGNERILWRGPVISLRVPGVPRMARAWMVVTSEALRLYYRKWFRWRSKAIPLAAVRKMRLTHGRLFCRWMVVLVEGRWVLGLDKATAETLPDRWMKDDGFEKFSSGIS